MIKSHSKITKKHYIQNQFDAQTRGLGKGRKGEDKTRRKEKQKWESVTSLDAPMSSVGFNIYNCLAWRFSQLSRLDPNRIVSKMQKEKPFELSNGRARKE